MSDLYARGAHLFDAGKFFDAHEAWEERWRVATDRAERDFLQGLIQVAAAFHKLVEMTSDGTSAALPGRRQSLEDAAARLLAKGLAKLDACPAHILEDGTSPAPPGRGQNVIHLARFREGVRACASDLAAGHFVRAAIPTIAV